ncbi:AAA family ATPase [Halomonas saccharevitans]|uniref:AAA family ATPase n=1 Tax=Halomonas saccharevitans TaxID=416872 RepID=A0ABU3NA25_9GAMM|nr:AAA family ATPase [Halomonas saccharevitans]MDT8878049.1 AAA family ATPase [Halomonas saccharevitans]
MPITQQRLIRLDIEQLKVLKDVSISFGDHPLTAILGPNGSGKSTVLHALACAFEPNTPQGEAYKFSSFFLPSTDALWEGSKMTLTHSYRDGQVVHDNSTQPYSKASDRWTPRYAKWPKRDVIYIGIDKCVPMIESENRQVRINYQTTQINEEIVLEILRKASFVLDRNYTAFNQHNAQGKEFIGVGLEGLQYSALSMSAGEQKVFYVLEKVFKASKYSLILLDELDLLLHEKSLKRLVTVINERARAKNLQVVFSTHRESLVDFEGEINIRHLFTGPQKTYCFEQTNPDAIARLTGTQPKPLEIYVEDEMASAIVRVILGKLKANKWVSVGKFGAAINSFTMAGGLLMRGEDCQNVCFVLDGDRYSSEEDIEAQINRVVTGHGEGVDEIRQAAKALILSFGLPDAQQPERYFHASLCQQPATNDEAHNEIVEAAQEVGVVANDHHYLSDILIRLGMDERGGLSRIAEIFSNTPEWEGFVQPVRDWLVPRLEILREVEGGA